MFKKVTVATAFSAALLLGGAFQTVDASASFDPSQSQADVSHQNDSSDGGERYIYNGTLQDFLDQLFNSDKGNWHSDEGESQNQGESEDVEQEEQPQAPEDTEQTENGSDDQSGDVEEDNDSDDQSGEVAEDNNSDDGQLNEFEKEVVSLTNDEREKNGLEPLESDAELSVVARDKSKDMQSNGYFSHESPTYGSPFDMMSDYGISYSTAGENIAHGQQSPEEVVDGWMNSEGHRENILNPDFTHIGVGYVEQGNYWTQEFTGK